MLILTMMSAKTPSHAQFNTIGYVKKHSVSKKKCPQETAHVASVDSVVKADTLASRFFPRCSSLSQGFVSVEKHSDQFKIWNA